MKKPIRILIADDHEVVRRGLRSYLEKNDGWEVCGEAGNGRDVLGLVEELKPNIVILDITMPGLNGIETARLLCKYHPDTEILIMSMHESEDLVRDALEAGAHAFVLKSIGLRDVVLAVEALAEHKPFFSSEISSVLLNDFVEGRRRESALRGSSSRLTGREREVLQLLAEGQIAKEVAQILHISIKTVDAHRMNIMRKLGIHSIAGLVRYAIRNKIIEP